MERDNYFAKSVNEQVNNELQLQSDSKEVLRLEKERNARTKLENAEKKRIIKHIQAERDAQAIGTAPEEVWGADAGKLCSDFLEFANGLPETSLEYSGVVKVFAGRQTEKVQVRSFPKKFEIKVINPGQTYYGHRVAFRDGTGWGGQEVKYGSPAPYPPRPDIMLCTDGLLRMVDKARSLRVIDVSGNVDVPAIGKMVLTEGRRYARDMSSPSDESSDFQEFVHYHPSFVKMKLEDVLYGAALNLARAVKGLL